MDDFQERRRDVERMIGDGVPFTEIEDFIDTVDLDSEEVGALWLIAWTEQGQPRQRAMVQSYLAALPLLSG